MLAGLDEEREDKGWRHLWKVQVPQRVRAFLWLAARDRLMINGNRVRRGLASDSRCGGCNGSLEDAVHVLRDCPHAMAFSFGRVCFLGIN